MSDAALVKIDEATRMLTEARDLTEILEIRDRAVAMQAYAAAKNAGGAANVAKEIQLRSERKAGKFLATQPKNQGGRPSKTGSTVEPVSGPTLSDLGVGKTQSHRWQTMAQLPSEEFEQHIARAKARETELTSKAIYKLAQKHKKREQQARVPEGLPPLPERCQLYYGDFWEVCEKMDPGSVDAIITDPPYPKEYIGLYDQLAIDASRLLKDGGSLAVMVGQSYLPEILWQMSQRITYRWTLAYLTPGGQSPQVWPRKVNAFWKPVLWFVNGEYEGSWIGDVTKSDVNDNDKRFHGWGQSESGMARLVEKFSCPGDVILDPFCGGGTTGSVALSMDRQFIGIDNDERSIRTSQRRIAELWAEKSS